MCTKFSKDQTTNVDTTYGVDCFGNDFENNLEKMYAIAWNLQHNAEKLVDILNRITSALLMFI